MSMQIKIRVPDEWRGDIERAATESGFPLEAPRGRVGGVAAWVKSLVARELGLSEIDPHEEQAAKFAAKRHESHS